MNRGEAENGIFEEERIKRSKERKRELQTSPNNVEVVKRPKTESGKSSCLL